MADKEKEEKQEPKEKKAVRKPAPVVELPVVKVFSFEQWAARRGINPRHRGGMKAFIKRPDKQRTLEEWDAAFANY